MEGATGKIALLESIVMEYSNMDGQEKDEDTSAEDTEQTPSNAAGSAEPPKRLSRLGRPLHLDLAGQDDEQVMQDFSASPLAKIFGGCSPTDFGRSVGKKRSEAEALGHKPHAGPLPIGDQHPLKADDLAAAGIQDLDALNLSSDGSPKVSKSPWAEAAPAAGLSSAPTPFMESPLSSVPTPATASQSRSDSTAYTEDPVNTWKTWKNLEDGPTPKAQDGPEVEAPLLLGAEEKRSSVREEEQLLEELRAQAAAPARPTVTLQAPEASAVTLVYTGTETLQAPEAPEALDSPEQAAEPPAVEPPAAEPPAAEPQAAEPPAAAPPPPKAAAEVDTEQDLLHQLKAGPEYAVTLHRTIGSEFGVVLEATPYGSLMVVSVEPGLIADWNMLNVRQEVRRGDHVVEVNGVRGKARKMLQELEMHRILHLKLRQALAEGLDEAGFEVPVSGMCRHIGCLKRLSIYDLGDHEANCAHRLVMCPNLCGLEIKAGEMAEHRLKHVKDRGRIQFDKDTGIVRVMRMVRFEEKRYSAVWEDPEALYDDPVAVRSVMKDLADLLGILNHMSADVVRAVVSKDKKRKLRDPKEEKWNQQLEERRAALLRKSLIDFGVDERQVSSSVSYNEEQHHLASGFFLRLTDASPESFLPPPLVPALENHGGVDSKGSTFRSSKASFGPSNRASPRHGAHPGGAHHKGLLQRLGTLAHVPEEVADRGPQPPLPAGGKGPWASPPPAGKRPPAGVRAALDSLRSPERARRTAY